MRVELANQLRAQLEASWPGALIFSGVDSPISLAFLGRYPGPGDAEGLGERRMAAFLQRNSYSGHTDPAVLVARMRSAPEGTAEAGNAAKARRTVVLALSAPSEPIVAEIAALTSRIRAALGTHPDAEIFASLFCDRKTAICPATLIAELGDCRERYPTEAAMAADAG